MKQVGSQKGHSIKKNVHIEYIRAISAIAVIAIHTINSAIIYSQTGKGSVIMFWTIIKNLLYWAVPCFAMISGILLLDKDKEISKNKYFNYIRRIAITLIIFGTGFSWIEIIFVEKTINPIQIISAIQCVMLNKTWAHLWYMYGLLTIYILLPIYRKMLSYHSPKIYCLLVAVVVILSILTGNRYIALHVYFLIGGIVNRIKLKRTISYVVLMSCIVLLSVISIVILNNTVKMPINLTGYVSPINMVLSVVLFKLLYEVNLEKKKRFKNLLLLIAEYSFGLYLVHMVFINLIYQAAKLQLMNNWSSLLIIPIMVILNLIFSWSITWIIKRIPVLRSLV